MVILLRRGPDRALPRLYPLARRIANAGALAAGNKKAARRRLVWRWLRGLDLNQRPSGYEPDELPDCSTPRHRWASETPKGLARMGQPSDL